MTDRALAPIDPSCAPFPWLLAYFRQTYPHRVEQTETGVEYVRLTDTPFFSEALHLAYTHDGFHWTALNGNEPVLAVPPRFGGLRDPFVRRGVDGLFHLVGTGGSTRGSILYARSADLTGWEQPRALSLMHSVPDAVNAWAPEFIYDGEQGGYLLFWSSSQGRHGWDDSRIWCARTDDFSAVSEPRVLFAPGFSVIDATIVPVDGTYRMFFKDERFGHMHGERRRIWMAVASHLEGPYEIVGDAVTPTITEGPEVMRLPGGQGWCLYYDVCMEDRYAVALSRDLLHWTPVEDASFPEHARHATVCPVQEDELNHLLATYGE